MKTKSKRLLAMSLATAMSLTAFAGCSGSSSSAGTDSSSGSGESKSDSSNDASSGAAESSSDADTTAQEREAVTIEVFSQSANYSGEQKGWIADILKEKFNVTVNIVQDPDGSQLASRMQTGDLGDIVVWGNQSEDYKQAIEKGYLLNWNKDDLLTNYGSYIKENLSDALERNSENNNGVCYGFTGSISLPGSANADGLIYTWDTRWDLYMELGKPEVTDLDSYIDLMKAMKEICPTDENGKETYALSMWPDWDGNMVMYVKAFATAYWGYDEWGIGLYDVNTGEVYGALEENGPYYTALKFMNELYREGLIDPNSRTQKYDQMTEKMKAGGCFFSIFKYAGQDIYNTAEHIADDKMMCSLIPSEATPIIMDVSTEGSGYEWTIGATTEYPELCMEIINWLATPEGALTYWYGPQGEDGCWDYDEDGNLYLTELGKTAQQDKTGTDMSASGHSGTFNDGSFQVNANIWGSASLIPGDSKGQSFLYTLWDSMQSEAACDTEADWRETTGEVLSIMYLQNNENAVHAPATGISFSNPSKTSDLYTSWSQVAKTVVSGSWNCVYAASDDEFEQVWSQMVSEAEGYGYADCVTYMEEQAVPRHEIEQILAE